jgi:hypothetical protein
VGFVELEQADARLQDAVRRISLKVQTLYREIRSKELGHYQAEIDQLGEEFDHQMLAWINNMRDAYDQRPLKRDRQNPSEYAMCAARSCVSYALAKVRV